MDVFFLRHYLFFGALVMLMGMSLNKHPKKRSRIYDLPDALDDDPSDLNSGSQSASENQAASAPDSSAESPSEKGTDPLTKKEAETVPFASSEYDSEEPAADDEFEAKNQRGSESDMKEEFGRFAKAADIHSKEIQKKAHQLEMKLHQIDLGKKKNISLWLYPITKEIIDVVCDQMNEDVQEVVLAAMLFFYRHAIGDERRMLHDMGFLLDNLALQNQELCMETSALEDLAQQAIELEASPYFSPDEDTLNGMDDFDYSKEQKGEH